MSRFPDHFSDRAERYAAHRPSYPSELGAALADLAPSGGLAWDAGCGPGRLTALLAAHFPRVVGTDASREQLPGRGVLPGDREVTGRPVYVRALAEEAPLASDTTDLITAAQAAHWFDLPRFYDEVRRVARPRGVLGLVTYGPPTIGEGVDPVLDRYRYDVLAEHWPSRSRHVRERYSSLPFPFEEVPTRQLDLEERWTAADFLGYAGTWSGTRALERARGREPFERFAEGLVEAWGGTECVRTVRWPLTVKAGRVGEP